MHQINAFYCLFVSFTDLWQRDSIKGLLDLNLIYSTISFALLVSIFVFRC
jgi:hypothetical protein